MRVSTALRVTTEFGGSGGYPGQTFSRRSRSAPAATWARAEEPPPSAAATTAEADPAVAPGWLQPVVDRLNHLAQLEDGWDGPGSVAIGEEVVRRTLDVLARVAGGRTRPPSISPGADGSLQLAWYVREFELEIDVPRSGSAIAVVYEHASGEEAEMSPTSPQLYALVERLTID